MHSSLTPPASFSDRMPGRATRWMITSSLLVLAAVTMAGPGPIDHERDSFRDEPSAAGLALDRSPILAFAVPRAKTSATGSTTEGPGQPPPVESVPAISAVSPSNRATHTVRKPVVDLESARTAPGAQASGPASDIRRAQDAMNVCLAKYGSIDDYKCVFSKRERINGKLTPLHVMSMKVRTKPNSVYLRFQQPGAGREAIYIDGRNSGKVVAHDVGLAKILAGTLWLDPCGSMAMEDCRHPITEAGIGPLINTLLTRWSHELTADESVVELRHDQPLGARVCTRIDTIHPQRHANFLFHRATVHIDRELGVPIRFEAYDWPKADGVAPELVEEYGYSDIKVNVGLDDHDFDVANREYAFGRL
jgi:hypothetical protein